MWWWTCVVLHLLLKIDVGISSSSTSWPIIKIEEEQRPRYVVTNIANFLKLTNKSKASLKITNPTHPGIDSLEINSTTGELLLKQRLDRDVLCDRRVSSCCSIAAHNDCKIYLQVAYVSGTEHIINLVPIQILDLNDNAPRFEPSSVTLRIAENSDVHVTKLYNNAFVAIDSDYGQNGVQSYRLVSASAGGGAAYAADELHSPFLLDRSDAQRLALQLRQPLDREHTTQYHLQLLAIDGGSKPRTGTLSITILVEDVNDNAPRFSQPSYKTTVREDIRRGESVLTVSATDKDSGENARISYEITGSKEASKFFTITSGSDGSGYITVLQSPDVDLLSRNRNINFYVVARDAGRPSKSAEVSVSVIVKDVNDKQPQVSVVYLSPDSFQVAALVTENQSPYDIAKVEVVDTDTGPGGLVECRSSNSAFRLESSPFTGANLEDGRTEYMLQLSTPLDREVAPMLHFSVLCHDKGEPERTGSASIVVRVADENDQSPVFSQTLYTFHLFEQNATPSTRTHVGVVKAVDKDDGVNAQITYSLIDVPDNLFQINPKSGEIRAVGSFDRENLLSTSSGNIENGKADALQQQDPVVRFSVRAVDGGLQPRSHSAQVEVLIKDKNDCPPTFKPTSVYEFSVPENERDLVVGAVQAEDLDDPKNYYALQYKLLMDVKNHEVSKFSINQNTGEIRLRQALDRELLNGYLTLQVAAYDRPRDHSEPQLTSTATVSIRIIDKNDNPPVIKRPLNNQEFVVKFSEPVGSKILDMEAVDADESGPNSQVQYTISSGGHDMFGLESEHGVLFVKRPLKDTSLKMFNLRLTAYDLAPARMNSSVKIRIRIHDGLTDEVSSTNNQEQRNAVGIMANNGGKGQRGSRGSISNSSLYDDRAIVICLAILFVLLLLGAAVLACFIKRRRDFEQGRQGAIMHAKYQLGANMQEMKLDETAAENRMLYETNGGLTLLPSSMPHHEMNECEQKYDDPLEKKLNTMGRLNSTEYQTLDGLLSSNKTIHGSHTYYEIHAPGGLGGGGGGGVTTLPNAYRKIGIDNKKQMDNTSESESHYFCSDGPTMASPDDSMMANTIGHCVSGNGAFLRQHQAMMVSGSTPVTPLIQRRAMHATHFNPYSEASFV